MTVIGPSLSGAKLWIMGGNMHKVATGDGARRLEISARRQGEFRRSEHVRAVEVFEVTAVKERTHVEMERVEGVGLAIVCPQWVDHAAEVVNFVSRQVDNRRMGRVPLNALLEKIDEVRTETRRKHGNHPVFEQGFIDTISLIDDARDVAVPFGYYHGDLTLCNVLCDCEKNPPWGVALIDFLDMVLPTPLFDIAKIRQDTERMWITLFTPEVDPVRLTAIDDIVLENFSSYDWWDPWYPVFDLLNLLRLLPYAPPGRVTDWITAELERDQ